MNDFAQHKQLTFNAMRKTVRTYFSFVRRPPLQGKYECGCECVPPNSHCFSFLNAHSLYGVAFLSA
jgi:hypothetical protein